MSADTLETIIAEMRADSSVREILEYWANRLAALPKQSVGVSLIDAERRRQVEVEGWSHEHDAEHSDGDLAMAAACYAIPFDERLHDYRKGAPVSWPWDAGWWRPTPGDRVRELVKAGALIAAEIDRIRYNLPPPPEGETT